MTGFEPARTDRQSIMLPGYITSPSLQKCAEQELNLQSSKASGLQPPGLANAQPTLVVSVAREGVEPTNDHEGLSFAALTVCVPRPVCLPHEIVVPELLVQCPEQGSNLQTSGFKPNRSADWRIQAFSKSK
jgi:hypothetical protein